MTYRWELSGSYDRDELAADGLLPTFDDQAAAEQWLGEYFDHLSLAGVETVSLYADSTIVYGPMSLEEVS